MISSSSVYGNQTILPINETAEKNPISPYGASKLISEHYCRIYFETYGLDVISLRYFTVYGPRQRPDMAIYKWTKAVFEHKPIIIYYDNQEFFHGLTCYRDRKVLKDLSHQR